MKTMRLILVKDTSPPKDYVFGCEYSYQALSSVMEFIRDRIQKFAHALAESCKSETKQKEILKHYENRIHIISDEMLDFSESRYCLNPSNAKFDLERLNASLKEHCLELQIVDATMDLPDFKIKKESD